MSKDRAFEDLRSLGEFLRQQVPAEVSEHVAKGAVGRRRPRRSRRWIAVVVTAVLFVLGNGALAQAADSAIPGDLLYPFDRAYEWIGDRFESKDRIPERVEEALALTEAGDTDRALSMVTEILAAESGEPDVAATVDRLVGSGNSVDVRNQVRDLVAAASLVHEAAQTGNHAALEAAIASVKEKASDVAETASEGQAGASKQDNPSVTAPVQIDSPSDRAPGQIDEGEGPSDTAPGQVKESDKADNRGSTTNTNNGGGQGGGNGRGGPKP